MFQSGTHTLIISTGPRQLRSVLALHLKLAAAYLPDKLKLTKQVGAADADFSWSGLATRPLATQRPQAFAR